MSRLTSRFPLLVSLLVCLSVLAVSIPARAQSGSGTALITAVETSAFPAMEVYLAVNDADDRHLAGLGAEAFGLTEDSAPVSALTVSEEEMGVQVVFLLDTSSAFKPRNANGITRLDFLKQALTDFAQTTPWMKDGVDDVSVLTPEGVLIQHGLTGAEVAQAVSSYTTDYAGVADTYPLINQALDFASDVTRRPGMRRYLVLISGGLTRSGSDSPIADVAARANVAQVEIQTVFVGTADVEDEAGAQKLRQLAKLTGGSYVLFEKPASLTPLFQHLADQRMQYRLSYRSTLAATGQHSLSATVQSATGTTLVSGESDFPLRLEPPSVMIHDVPELLNFDAASPPAEYAVPITVDFPDGHPRNLNEVQLLVDGNVVATQTQVGPPPETLAWPLKDDLGSEAHTLQVHVTDELGLAADSATVEVALDVSSTPMTQRILRPLTWPLIAAIGLGVMAAVGLVLIVRRTPKRRRSRLGDTMPIVPVTPDTVPAAPLPRDLQTKPRSTLRPAGPSFHLANAATQSQSAGKAYFEVVESGGGGSPRDNIEMRGESLRLGREAALADVVFHDRSVSRRHARIVEETEGVFRIYDEGSTSGTWVNFTQVPKGQGRELQPGDVINLGRVQLRFKRRDVPASGNSAKAAEPHRPT